MSGHPDPRPDQGPTGGVTPHIGILDGRGREAIAWYERAFGAEEAMPAMRAGDVPGMAADDERIMHAHLQVNGGSLMLHDAFPEHAGPIAPPSGVMLHLQVDDADRWFSRAVDAGAEATMPPSDTFWGDRYGQLRDSFGHEWSIGSTPAGVEG